MKNVSLPKLSVVIPCYDEEHTLKACVEKLLEIAPGVIDLEIIIVDDCSKDRSLEIAMELQGNHKEIKVISHQKNRGKGAALRTGFKEASGEFITVQDADLEYDPNDYIDLLQPIVDDFADVVFGSRFIGRKPHRILFYWHSKGNKFLTNPVTSNWEALFKTK